MARETATQMTSSASEALAKLSTLAKAANAGPDRVNLSMARGGSLPWARPHEAPLSCAKLNRLGASLWGHFTHKGWR
jgi:hypothetical protein